MIDNSTLGEVYLEPGAEDIHPTDLHLALNSHANGSNGNVFEWFANDVCRHGTEAHRTQHVDRNGVEYTIDTQPPFGFRTELETIVYLSHEWR